MLEDDPTGPQLLVDAPVALRVDAPTIAAAAAAAATSSVVHILTNSRALSAQDAYQLTVEAASAALCAFPDADLLARGDSTLRGHPFEEYRAIRDVLQVPREPVLLLVPALPGAGRVTVDGVHLIEREGRRIPLHLTEYAHDGEFAYRDARLLQWIEDRSAGAFARTAGVEVPLERLRCEGPWAVHDALEAAASSGRLSACVPDAETADDLEIIASGFRRARASGVPVVVRCAPALAAVLAGQQASGLLASVRCRRGVLVVSGSYLPMSARQVARLRERYPGALVELDVEQVLRQPEREVDSLAETVRALLTRDRIAVLATPPLPDYRLESLEVGSRVAAAMAGVVARVRASADLFVFKGGVTSAICLREGIGAAFGIVRGPVLPGVALWELHGAPGPCLVVPGNVGTEMTLLELVEQALAV